MCGKKCRTNDFLNKHVALSFLMDEPFGIISDLTDKNAFLSTTSFWANAKKWYAQPFVFFSLRDGLSWSLSKKTRCCCGGVVHSRYREIWKTAGFRHFFYWNSLTGYLFQTTFITLCIISATSAHPFDPELSGIFENKTDILNDDTQLLKFFQPTIKLTGLNIIKLQNLIYVCLSPIRYFFWIFEDLFWKIYIYILRISESEYVDYRNGKKQYNMQ